MSKYLLGQAQRFFRQMDDLRSASQQQRHEIAEEVFEAIKPHLDSADVDALRKLRRAAQDQRAVLLYQGARDFTNVHYAACTLIEQWAAAKADSGLAHYVGDVVLAERRLREIEAFVADNLLTGGQDE